MIKAEIFLNALTSDNISIKDNNVVFENLVTVIDPKTLRVENDTLRNGIIAQQTPITVIFPEVSLSVQDAMNYAPELMNEILATLEIVSDNSDE